MKTKKNLIRLSALIFLIALFPIDRINGQSALPHCPDTNNVCVGISYRCSTSSGQQTLNGSRPVDPWMPNLSNHYSRYFSQTNSCHIRTERGIKSYEWLPSESEVYRRFDQTNVIGQTRSILGTKVSNVFPVPSQVCSGQTFPQYNACGESNYLTGIKACSNTCVPDGSQVPRTSDVLSGQLFQAYDSCGNVIRLSSGSIQAFRGTRSSARFPDKSQIGEGVKFNQINDCGYDVGEETGTKKATVWSPDPSTVCFGTRFTQISDIGTIRTWTGSLNLIPWYSFGTAHSYCKGTFFPETNGCTVRQVEGLRDCSTPPSLSISVNPDSINLGDQIVISYTVGNDATSCTASVVSGGGEWNGSKNAVSGNQEVTPGSIGTYVYYLICQNSSGDEVSNSAEVRVESASSPLNSKPSGGGSWREVKP